MVKALTNFGIRDIVPRMVGKMEAGVIELEERLGGVTSRMTEMECRVEAKFLQAE